MATLLLILIYTAFISLGLPDSIIGVAWPVMQIDLQVPLEYGGYISLIITLGTISSSLLSGFLISRLKTGKVIVLSISLTAIALLGYSFSNYYILFMFFALPLGFGAGSIDTALNNYVALNYKPHHMNWLHSFWGVGASIGPMIMSFYLMDENWQRGFFVIGLIQIGLLIIITLSLPLWKRQDKIYEEALETYDKPKKITQVKGVLYALLIFLIYCAIEFSIGIWGSTFLVKAKLVEVSFAARIIMGYYLGITGGRFISGGLSFKFSNRTLIYGGITILFIGSLLLFLSENNTMYIISFALLGLGLAPIFPSMIHDTPRNFGKENSQYVIGYQVAFAYIGSAIFPSMFGVLYSKINVSLFPFTIFILTMLLLILIILLVFKTKELYKKTES